MAWRLGQQTGIGDRLAILTKTLGERDRFVWSPKNQGARIVPMWFPIGKCTIEAEGKEAGDPLDN